MLASLLSFISLSVWNWSSLINPFGTHTLSDRSIVNLNWDIVPSYATDFFEHLPDQFIGNIAALNHTLTPQIVKEHFIQDEIKDIETVLVYINWEDLPENTINWIKEHSQETAFITLDIGLFIAPWLLTDPLLAVLGFRRIGPVAGSAAAIAERAIGKSEARGFFAQLQSAGMRGYGKGLFEGIARSGIALKNLIKWIWGSKGQRKESSAATFVANAL
ncbi:uncharacterized protein L201_006226 [Kwoniella dendrophila CBS 6074]|uniref:Uncharacterized protein n=1 Tax=Kwoniella dendrophila CBS 6074 TaxID=1295534 RepID=A0AAX4K283_9TREE